MATTEARASLQQQDLSKLDVTKLTAVSPEVISRQATINIGTIGHVAHGKSTVVKAISGVQTVRFKNELERNITIKLERLTPETIDRYTGENGRKKARVEREYAVERVVDARVDGGEPSFLVEWKGWPSSNATWEPFEHLANCKAVLSEYLRSAKSAEIERFIDETVGRVDCSDAELRDLWRERHEVSYELDAVLHALCYFRSNDEVEKEYFIQRLTHAKKVSSARAARKRQTDALKRWRDEMNAISGKIVIEVENSVDLTGPPANFTYINEKRPFGDVIVPEDPPIGCDCRECSAKSGCACGTNGGLFPYDRFGRLRVDAGVPVYECNKNCACAAACNNRTVQNGSDHKLCIFRTSNGRGWGVKTLKKILRGEFICEYVGELIPTDEAERRGECYDAEDRTYLFDLDFNGPDNPYSIDAARFGNVAHFINHSCDPNLGVWAVWGDCLDPNLHAVALFSCRAIAAGEELCFDYSQQTNDAAEKSDGSPRKVRTRTECKCGTEKCRKFVFV